MLADLPLMNPFDWILILNIVSRDPIKYEPICSYIKRLLKAHIIEIAKMDIEISSVLNKRPIVKHMEPQENIDSLKAGFTENKNWGVVIKVENEFPKKCVFYFMDKHLYSSVALNQILSTVEKFKKIILLI